MKTLTPEEIIELRRLKQEEIQMLIERYGEDAPIVAKLREAGLLDARSPGAS